MQLGAYDDAAIAAAFKAVADPARVRILATILHAGELCVCHVEGALGLTQSRASRHLATLKRAGLIVDRREGAWVHYKVPPRPDPIARAILKTIRATIAEDPAIHAVATRAAKLRRASGCAEVTR